MGARQEILAPELLADDASARTGEGIRRGMETAFVECARRGLPVSLLYFEAIRLDRQAAQLGVRPADIRRALVEILRRDARGVDVMACEEGAGILVLLPNTGPETAELIGRQAIDDAKQLTLVGLSRPVRVGLCVGFASSSGRGDLFFDTLVLVACEGAAVARQRGGECFVHTMLYEVMQRRAEKLALASGKSTPGLPRELEEVSADERPGELATSTSAGAVKDELAEARPLSAEEEIDILKRRIAKLNRALEVSEQTLAQVSASKGLEDGIASTYREVQGLSPAEPDRERKQAILREIFAANLELQRLRRTRAEALPPELGPTLSWRPPTLRESPAGLAAYASSAPSARS